VSSPLFNTIIMT